MRPKTSHVGTLTTVLWACLPRAQWFARPHPAKAVVGCIAMLLLSALPSAVQGDHLIVELPHVEGPPPQYSGGRFFSRTPTIKFFTPVDGIHMEGRDFPDTTCEGHEFHVVSSCEVNGSSVPYTYMTYALWFGICTQVYVWQQVEVKLGQPGEFTIDLEVDNSLGIGYVGISPWGIWEVGDPPPEYEILSAEFDKSVYQNGVDTAQLTVVTKSNWGYNDDLTLTATMVPNLGEAVSLPSDAFTLTPGEERTSHFYWSVPAYADLRHADLSLDLSDATQCVAGGNYNLDIACTPVDPDTLEQIEQDMAACQVGAACGQAALAAVPFYGVLSATHTAASLSCLTEGFYDQGNHKMASQMRMLEGAHMFMTRIGAVSDVIGLVVGAVDVPVILADLAIAAAVCGSELAYWNPPGPQRSEPGDFIDEFADSAQTAYSNAGIPFSNVMFVEGPCSVRVLLDSCHTTADSVGINAAFVQLFPNHSSSWTHIGPEPTMLGDDTPNPNDHCAVEVRSDSTGSLAIILLHKNEADSTLDLRYALIPIIDSSVVYATLVDSVAVIPLELDYDGDGDIEQIYYPGGIVVDAPDAVGEEANWAVVTCTQPNPFGSKTTVRFSLSQAGRAAVTVYDVSGRLIRRLHDGHLASGPHSLTWNGRDATGRSVPSGVYFYRLETGERVETVKLVKIQ